MPGPKEIPQTVDIPLSELAPIDVSERNIEQRARGFIMGSESVKNRKEIRDQLENQVTKRIGKKGKYLVDKLFELIEGVYIVQGTGKNEVRYYKVPPNLAAIQYALDRALGKPTPHKDDGGDEKKGMVLVESIIKNLAADGTVKSVEERRSVEVHE